jgi:hypothetical protein
MARLWDAVDDVDLPVPSDRSKLVSWWAASGDSTLVGYAAIALPAPFDGIVIGQIPAFRDPETGAWNVGQPMQWQIDGTGKVKVFNGVRQHQKIITFQNREARERWRRIVLQAMADGGVGPGP